MTDPCVVLGKIHIKTCYERIVRGAMRNTVQRSVIIVGIIIKVFAFKKTYTIAGFFGNRRDVGIGV